MNQLIKKVNDQKEIQEQTKGERK